MALDEARIREVLSAIRYPGFSRDIVTLGVVRRLAQDAGRVTVELVHGPGGAQVVAALEDSVREAVSALPGVSAVEVRTASASGASPGLNVVGQSGPAAPPAREEEPDLLPGVRHIVAVASGKGGVGKSTVAVNLAVALARSGRSVGLLDADIYGPSIPLMMGARDRRPEVDAQAQRLLPLEGFGVRFMSLGFLVDPEEAVIWRGPLVMKALEQLIRDVAWGDLDVLVVDLPPGTGDAQLTLSQRVRLTGAVVVTTPQDVALADAIKGVAMFRKVGVPVLGIVENMSYFQCPHCSGRTDIFGHGGGGREAARLGVPLLGEIPLEAQIRTSGDEGKPVAAAKSGGGADAFLALARAVSEALTSDAAHVGIERHP